MTDNKDVRIRRKPRPKQDPNNKEQASTHKNKKRRWKKHHKKPKKNLGERLQELQAFINSKYHAD